MAFTLKIKNPTLANNIANALTASRIVLTPVFALCLLYTNKYPHLHFWAIVTAVIMILTDCFDGAIAKRWGVASPLGSFLDPVADKIAIDVAFVIISIKYNFPVWATIIVVSRDVFVLGAWCFFLLVLEESFIAVPHLFGKLMVSSQALTVVFVLLKLQEGIIRWAWRVTIFFSIASLVIYAVNLKKYRKAVE
jgi:CDP-diacylglycerol--glycerol-3-phosphate 3-phosphatidyltransferase